MKSAMAAEEKELLLNGKWIEVKRIKEEGGFIFFA